MVILGTSHHSRKQGVPEICIPIPSLGASDRPHDVSRGKHAEIFRICPTHPMYPSLPHAFLVLEIVGLASGATDASGVSGSSSVGGPQDGPHLGVLHHVFPQPVIVAGAYGWHILL